jgi:uncharacterized UBP type Zn finger protein
MSQTCSHLDDLPADGGPPPAADGCVECLAMGSRWVHLRRCVACGHVGCCDSSPNKHATAHHRETQHPLVQSFEPREEWIWCYADDVGFEVDGLPRPSPSHP